MLAVVAPGETHEGGMGVDKGAGFAGKPWSALQFETLCITRW